LGFVLGLPDNIYSDISNLEDLKVLLKEEGIDINDANMRFIGLNDKYDRGSDPVGIFDLVEWLRSKGKAKPFVGNHEFWRIMSVFGAST